MVMYRDYYTHALSILEFRNDWRSDHQKYVKVQVGDKTPLKFNDNGNHKSRSKLSQKLYDACERYMNMTRTMDILNQQL